MAPLVRLCIIGFPRTCKARRLTPEACAGESTLPALLRRLNKVAPCSCGRLPQRQEPLHLVLARPEHPEQGAYQTPSASAGHAANSTPRRTPGSLTDKNGSSVSSIAFCPMEDYALSTMW